MGLMAEGERGKLAAEMVAQSAAVVAGALSGDPVLTIAGAFFAPLASSILLRVGAGTVNALQDLAERVAESGDVQGLLDHLAGRPAASALLLDASQAVARTEYEVKVEAIGRAIAGGVLYEEGVAFDIEAVIVRTICRLERPHVAVLLALGDDRCPEADLRSGLPSYATVLPGLLAELHLLGLVVPTTTLYPGSVEPDGARVSDHGRAVRQRYEDAGARSAE